MEFNSLIEELHNSLINDINKSHLPVGVVYYVAKDVFSKVESNYYDTLEQEKENAINNQNEKDSPQEEEIEDGHQE